jgi:hypothetical protein
MRYITYELAAAGSGRGLWSKEGRLWIFVRESIFSPAALTGAVREVGADALMFSVDYARSIASRARSIRRLKSLTSLLTVQRYATRRAALGADPSP